MTEIFRIDTKNGVSVASRCHYFHKDSFIIEVYQPGEKPFKVFELNVQESRFDPKYFSPEKGFVEFFAIVVEAVGADELKKHFLRFGEVPLKMNWWTIQHDGKGLSELEKAFLAILCESNEIYSGWSSPPDRMMKIVRTHAKVFVDNPPTTVDEALMFASPAAMRYGKDSYHLMKLFSSSRRKKLLTTARSRRFYHKLYSLALTGEESDGELFGSWEAPPVESLPSKSGAFEFVENFPSQQEFIDYLNGLMLGEIKTVGLSDAFSHRKASVLAHDLIVLCERVVSGKKQAPVRPHLLAVEALTALVRVRESHAAAGVKDVPPPSAEKRRTTVRGGPHLYSELLELFIGSSDSVATLQAIKEYCESSACTVRTRADMWELGALLLRGNLKSWIKNGAQSDSVINALRNEIGGARTIELIMHVKDENTPLTAKQWGEVAAGCKDLEGAPVSWFLTVL